MSVAFKSKTDVSAIFSHLGVDPAVITDKGYTMDGGISQIRIYNGETIVATIKMGVLLSNVLSFEESSHGYIKLKSLLTEVGNTIKPGVTISGAFEFDMVWLANILADSASTSAPKADPVATSSSKPVNPKVAMNGKPVPLREATDLYQRVNGTSKDALYYVVGISDCGLKLAMKKTPHGASLRAEWTKHPKVEVFSSLNSFGIDTKSNYASGHFNLSQTTHKRMLGAVLCSLPVTWTTPIPDTDLLKESP